MQHDQGQTSNNQLSILAATFIGSELYAQISAVSLKLYKEAASHAESCGLILADTKFEFGLVPTAQGKSLILVDEALTPDSSRYWPLSGYAPGKPQPSFDKQFLRDWLEQAGFRKGLERGKDGEGWVMEEQVVTGTKKRYLEVVEMLTREKRPEESEPGM